MRSPTAQIVFSPGSSFSLVITKSAKVSLNWPTNPWSEPKDSRDLPLAIDGSAKDVEHPREDVSTDWGFQRITCILDLRASRESLGRCKRNTSYMMLVKLGQNLNGYFTMAARA